MIRIMFLPSVCQVMDWSRNTDTVMEGQSMGAADIRRTGRGGSGFVEKEAREDCFSGKAASGCVRMARNAGLIRRPWTLGPKLGTAQRAGSEEACLGSEAFLPQGGFPALTGPSRDRCLKRKEHTVNMGMRPTPLPRHLLPGKLVPSVCLPVVYSP